MISLVVNTIYIIKSPNEFVSDNLLPKSYTFPSQDAINLAASKKVCSLQLQSQSFHNALFFHDLQQDIDDIHI